MYLARSSVILAALSLCDGTGVLCPTSGGKQIFGYQQVTKTNRYFYTVIEADTDPEKSPTFLFLPGGPGLSCMTSIVSQIGPCILNPDGGSPESYGYSWTKTANGIWVDAPGSTGFSKGPTERSVKEWINNLFTFLSEVLKKQPRLNTQIYLAGASADGSTVGLLASKILETKADINLKGVLILASVTGPTDIYRGCLEKAEELVSSSE